VPRTPQRQQVKVLAEIGLVGRAQV